jgi:hypothetical protein
MRRASSTASSPGSPQAVSLSVRSPWAQGQIGQLDEQTYGPKSALWKLAASAQAGTGSSTGNDRAVTAKPTDITTSTGQTATSEEPVAARDQVLRIVGAQERTRTSTTLRPLDPESSASANSATWARVSFDALRLVPSFSPPPAGLSIRSPGRCFLPSPGPNAVSPVHLARHLSARPIEVVRQGR